MMRVGFGVKLTLLVLVPILAISAVFYQVVQRATTDFVHRQMRERGLSLVTNLARSVEYPMYVGMTDQLDQAAQVLTSKVGEQRLNPDLAFVFIVDAGGQVLVKAGKRADEAPAAKVVAGALGAEQPGAVADDVFFLFYAPVRYKETVVMAMAEFGELEDQTKTTLHELGGVALGLDLGAVRARQQELSRTILQATGAALVLALILSVVLTRSVTRPIAQLRQGVLALERGDMGARVRVVGNDEISEAAGQFNRMAESLEKQTEDLRRSNTALETTKRQLEGRMKDLSFLYDLEIEAAAVTSLQDMSLLFARQLERQFTPEEGWLVEEGHDPVFIGEGPGPAPPPGVSVNHLSGLLGTGGGARLLSPGRDATPLARWADALGDPAVTGRTVLSLAVVIQKHVVGALVLVAPQGVAWTMEDLRTLEMTATAYANHVERVTLLEREKDMIKAVSEREASRKYTTELEGKNEKLNELNGTLQKAYDELQKAQQQLVQSEKLATVGTLAGGIAHEINNPLGAILANTQMLQRKLDDEGVLRGLSIIEKGAVRCKNIVEKVLRFARQRDKQHTEVDFKQVVEDTLTLLHHQMKRVTVQQQLEPVPKVWGDAGELEQVLTNLLLNAHYAVMKAAEQDGREPAITLTLGPDGEEVALSVRDNGVGMSEEVQRKIFDPFFTTKEVGQGTGLGLSVTYSILQSHRATVHVQSREGVGTTITLRFPTTPPPKEAAS